MQRKNCLSLALVAAGCIASTPVFAAPVLLSQTFQLSNALDRNSVSLNFDLGSFLSGKGYGSADIVSGNATLRGYSDIQYGSASITPYSGYVQTGQSSRTIKGETIADPNDRSFSCLFWDNCRTITPTYTLTDKQFLHSRDVRHDDLVADAMRLLIGNTSALDTADTKSPLNGTYGSATHERDECASFVPAVNGCNMSAYYARERDTYSAIYGALDTRLSFDAAALLDLRSDGILGVGVQATAGQFKLNSISFDLMVEKAAAVPEPASLLLASSALAGLLLTTRRRRQVSTVSMP